jgi:hypothetical protein
LETFYSTQAIEEIREGFVKALGGMIPADAAYAEGVLQVLEKAVKFRLPDAGDLLGIERKGRLFMRSDFDVLHMPYPAVALEYTFAAEKQTLHEGRFLAAKRITLVIDVPAGEGKAGIFEKSLKTSPWFFDKGGLIIVGLWSNDDEPGARKGASSWEMAGAFGIIPRNQDADFSALPVNEGSGKRGDLTILNAVAMNGLLTFHSQRLGSAKAKQLMLQDLDDDVHIALDFMLALSCNNVKVANCTEASREKLNKKRIKSGKVPFFEYKELQIDGVRLAPGEARASGTTDSGRQGPRMHLRRGHIRRLENGKRTWVNMTIVGAANTGVIDKSYVVKPVPPT